MSLTPCSNGTDPLLRLTKLQGRQTQQREKNCEDQKSKYDLRFLPILHLEVMMQRRHLKKTTTRAVCASRHLEYAHLKQHGQRFNNKDATHHQQHEFLLRKHGDCSHRPAYSQAAGVAHKNFSGWRVVPEKSKTGAHHRTAKDC